jgi:hypothetical protein
VDAEQIGQDAGRDLSVSSCMAVLTSKDQSFSVLRENSRFAALMILGSITGTILGGLLLGVIPAQF